MKYRITLFAILLTTAFLTKASVNDQPSLEAIAQNISTNIITNGQSILHKEAVSNTITA
jgi:hypothetical protein